MTDAELVRLARDGQRSAQEQLARRYAPRLLAVCRARIGPHEAAEDLAQEALLRGLTHLENLKQPQKLGAWLRGIAVRVCLDWLRSRSRQQVPFSRLQEGSASEGALMMTDTAPSQQAHVEQLERRAHLSEAIDGLSEELREPLLMFYYDDITYEQIARMLGVSRATVNARLAKARAQLSRTLAHLTR